MNLLLSNTQPAKLKGFKTQEDIWLKNSLNAAYKLKIATGFVSSDSLIELKKIVELNKRPHIDLLIGMHYFDKFTKTQYEAALELNKTLESNNLGSVYLSQVSKFHGKMYSFSDREGKCFGAMVGSSNLSSLLNSSEKLYEVDCFFEEWDATFKIDSTINLLLEKLGTKLSDADPISEFKKNNGLLKKLPDVEEVPHSKLLDIWKTRTNIQFDLPVKPTPQSNLNIYFGVGRENKRSLVKPRPWYEAEIIVGVEFARDNKDFPKHKRFKVYTDDGWSFYCKTSGTNSKNLRSADSLLVFGKWIKGRLEDSNALKVGEPVTDDVLNKYGNRILKLIGTKDPDVWLMEYKAGNVKP